MSSDRRYIRLLLNDLKTELKRQDLWRDEPPPVKALDSNQPFCVDSLRLEEWLQFIFIGRMEAILDRDAPLPETCAIEPYAEEQFATTHNTRQLLRILGKLDIMISRTP